MTTASTPKNNNHASAKLLAKEFGYTSDYIGRLARTQQIVGEKINGVWFIDRDSFLTFVDSVKKEKERRTKELSAARSREYFNSLHQQAATSLGSDNATTVTFARLVGAVAGAFVFFSALTVGYTAFQDGGPQNIARAVSQKIMTVEIGVRNSGATETLQNVYRQSGELVLSASKRIVVGYTNGVLTLHHAPVKFLNWHDRFSDHLADLWIDRDMITKELASDMRSVSQRVVTDAGKTASIIIIESQKTAHLIATTLFESVTVDDVQNIAATFSVPGVISALSDFLWQDSYTPPTLVLPKKEKN
ncbi:MAG: hypothetical protein ACJKTH_00015 [Patescibacteria group bacterium UBA2163]